MQQSLTCCLNVIFSNGDFFVRLDKNDNGKTNAALPTRTSPSKIELMPMDLPGLKTGTRKFQPLQTESYILKLGTEQLHVKSACIYEPVTGKLPLLDVEGIHPDIQEEKSLGDEGQSSKGMPK